jgi:Na+-transporting methylmalonyl-CoA/oxaloacetate decarboxylase gamma subunit
MFESFGDGLSLYFVPMNIIIIIIIIIIVLIKPLSKFERRL